MGQDGLASSVLSRLTFDTYIVLVITLYSDPGQIIKRIFLDNLRANDAGFQLAVPSRCRASQEMRHRSHGNSKNGQLRRWAPFGGI